jgi:poly(A) polymerase Pap1/uncharacterized protein (UPF0248 family)
LSLDAVGFFSHRHDNTIYRHTSDPEQASQLKDLRRTVLEALGHQDSEFRMHMTVAQSEDINSDIHRFLERKVRLLPEVEWEVDTLHILERRKQPFQGKPAGQMVLTGSLFLSSYLLPQRETPREALDSAQIPPEADAPATADPAPGEDVPQGKSSYYFDDELMLWQPLSFRGTSEPQDMPGHLAVSSYNVLAEFSWPPSPVRYPLLIKNILSKQAVADILILEEVTDDFLSYLLRDDRIRDVYPYGSHGPPDQADVEPLPNFLNLVILSRWAFYWEPVPFSRKHKGALVARFLDVGKKTPGEGHDSIRFLPLIVAAVHLNHGLADGTVAAKKTDINRILDYLSEEENRQNPCILAGDFNISTSSYTIAAAVQKGTLSAQSASYLAGFEESFSKAHFLDSWAASGLEFRYSSDSADEGTEDGRVNGEEGATYDPLKNEVAASIVGNGYNMRPQRYDRVLIRGVGLLSVAQFNKFGLLKERIGDDDESEPSYASDHWGVRSVLAIELAGHEKTSEEMTSMITPVVLQSAPRGFLSEPISLNFCLTELGVIPSDAEAETRKGVFNLLKRVILDTGAKPSSYRKSQSPLVVVPAGSYGLGVWTSDSDIDCLCIGPFSSKTFFALATQRLRKAAGQGVKILRRVKAHTGTMLELEIGGIKLDLQYCPATYISENWPQVLSRPATDPVWSLSAQTLSKLKAVRDLDYLRRTIPDLSDFRLVHQYIKTWAKSRGIYAAKFGYLSGFQITILLATVHKHLVRERGSISAPDLLMTFFDHYSNFDWRNKLVFDPFFHRQRLNYTRTSREPLAILGYFPPALNTAQAASQSSVRTIMTELRHAADRLSSAESLAITWSDLLNFDRTSAAFLMQYKSYVKINLHYWGTSLSKGAQFIGWLESRCVMLLVDTERRLTDVLHSRIWPARFVEKETAAGSDRGDYQGCYLIGLESLVTDKDKLKDALGALRTVLRRFAEQIRGDEKYFDGKTCWISVELMEKAAIEKLALGLDQRDWGEYNPAEEEEEEGENDQEDSEQELRLYDDLPDVIDKKRKKGKKPTTAESVIVPKLEAGKRFRTAADVMNRLRWDPEMDSGDFVVGYEDRFLDAQEKALEAWKSEQTDDEFIPQHRILYFKRKSDGVVVWERKTRKDDIFGSGVEGVGCT